MSKINDFVATLSMEEAEETRKVITKHVAALKKGTPIKEEPVANAGAGKEPVTPIKVAKTKKAVVKTEPEEIKPAAKAVEAKNTDGKREIAFPATASHTKALKEGLNNPDTKQFTKDKQNFKKYCEGLTDSEWDDSTIDEHVENWLKLKNEPKAEEPLTFDILSIEELKGMKGLTETKTVGIYWHPETGRHVTGQTDSEEGLDEVGDHLVGENTKRVYTKKDEKFLGFAGIGKFESM